MYIAHRSSIAQAVTHFSNSRDGVAGVPQQQMQLVSCHSEDCARACAIQRREEWGNHSALQRWGGTVAAASAWRMGLCWGEGNGLYE